MATNIGVVIDKIGYFNFAMDHQQRPLLEISCPF